MARVEPAPGEEPVCGHARALYDAVAGPGHVPRGATRMGGLHGYGEDGASAPLGGGGHRLHEGVRGGAGAARDGPRASLVKAVDVDREVPDEQVAALAHRRNAGRSGRRRGRAIATVCAIRSTCARNRRAMGVPGLVLGPDTVVVVTGAAGGITSAIVADLGRGERRRSFYLLDLAATARAGRRERAAVPRRAATRSSRR